jgi:predicted O-methyltransferase YrrM
MNNETDKNYLDLSFQNNENKNKNFKFKKIRMNDENNKNNNNIKIFSLIISLNIIFFFYFLKSKKQKNKNKYDIDFDYTTYENYTITKKIIENAGMQIGRLQPYFINGLIRKYKPKNCLEIGVANGGSSILILNAIKDIPNSRLVSLDLNIQLYNDPTKKTGYRVNQYFPELTKNWILLTGQQPHKFLIKLNMKFDFVFLDTAHSAPGELLNFIELLPFLNENAIFVLHDLLWHFHSKIKFYPSNVHLYPAIYGDKVLLQKKDESIENMGAVFLYNNQESHYLDYFFLLLTFWEYMPKDNEIKDLRIFIKNYYKKDIYLKIFDTAVMRNKISINNHHQNERNYSFINKKQEFFKDLVYGKKY